MAPKEEWTPESVARILMNPRYCLSNPPVVPEDVWIKANARTIEDIGAEAYLTRLLSILRPDYT
jgi:hypothetical protein